MRRPAAFAFALAIVCLTALGDEGPASVGPIAVTVSDSERSVAFYTKVLGFRKIADREFHDPAVDKLDGLFGARIRVVDLRLGGEVLELLEFRNIAGRPVPPDSQSNDRWFQHIAIVTRDMDAAVRRLEQHRVRPTSVAAQRLPDWNPNAAGIQAYYFRDPDGHNLEIICFPPGKGDPRWQSARRALFLGIDHTAIVVADTERSLRYYRDLLGLRVVGGSRNSGIEQAYLNHVRGARLRITSLRAGSGPGIEFLHYERPGAGRPFPRDATPADLTHWQTTIRYAGWPAPFSATPPVRIPATTPWAGESRLVRDPDGHALLLNQPRKE
jgi:catechol 2,3-dioxygenase-like lactoylglutathione lyase family enzyme